MLSTIDSKFGAGLEWENGRVFQGLPNGQFPILRGTMHIRRQFDVTIWRYNLTLQRDNWLQLNPTQRSHHRSVFLVLSYRLSHMPAATDAA